LEKAMSDERLHDLDRRVAVLEQIARDTATALADIRAELRGLRTEIGGLRTEVGQVRTQLHGDFLWLFRFTIGGFVGVLALFAHGLHWL
jgi:hypothetical protein